MRTARHPGESDRVSEHRNRLRAPHRLPCNGSRTPKPLGRRDACLPVFAPERSGRVGANRDGRSAGPRRTAGADHGHGVVSSGGRGPVGTGGGQSAGHDRRRLLDRTERPGGYRNRAGPDRPWPVHRIRCLAAGRPHVDRGAAARHALCASERYHAAGKRLDSDPAGNRRSRQRGPLRNRRGRFGEPDVRDGDRGPGPGHGGTVIAAGRAEPDGDDPGRRHHDRVPGSRRPHRPRRVSDRHARERTSPGAPGRRDIAGRTARVRRPDDRWRRPRSIRRLGSVRAIRRRLVSTERSGFRPLPRRALELHSALGMDLGGRGAVGIRAVPLRPMGRGQSSLGLDSAIVCLTRSRQRGTGLRAGDGYLRGRCRGRRSGRGRRALGAPGPPRTLLPNLPRERFLCEASERGLCAQPGGRGARLPRGAGPAHWEFQWEFWWEFQWGGRFSPHATEYRGDDERARRGDARQQAVGEPRPIRSARRPKNRGRHRGASADRTGSDDLWRHARGGAAVESARHRRRRIGEADGSRSGSETAALARRRLGGRDASRARWFGSSDFARVHTCRGSARRGCVCRGDVCRGDVCRRPARGGAVRGESAHRGAAGRQSPCRGPACRGSACRGSVRREAARRGAHSWGADRRGSACWWPDAAITRRRPSATQ